MSESVVNRTIGFPLGDVEETEILFKAPVGEGAYSYARRKNPTVSDCECALAEIEMAEWCVLAPCGMAAINIALSIFNDPRDRRPWLFPADAYSGTRNYATQVLQNQRDVNIKFAERAGQNSTTANLMAAIEDEAPALVFMEPISNPLLNIIDVHAVAAAAHGQGARVVVDNTFGTSYLFHPLDAGADLVVHSATKYLGGHNNILAGVIGVNDPDLRVRLMANRNMIGSVMSPDDAARLKTQLLTFPLRLARQNATAVTIAEYLEGHPSVAKVRYPGLNSHGDHNLAQQMFGQRGFGGMITFDLACNDEGARRFVENLSPHIPHIGSLGDVDTTFLHVQACFGDQYEMSSIRLSVGIEPPEQIMAGLAQAL